MHDPNTCLGSGVGGGLPGAHHIGQEPGAGRVTFSNGPVPGVAVPADRRTGNQHRRLGIKLGNCPHDGGGAIDSAGENLTLVVIGPAMVSNTGAGQVNYRFGSGEPGNINGAGDRIPGDLIGRRRPPANESKHLMALCSKVGDERRADQPGCSGDCDFHLITDLARLRMKLLRVAGAWSLGSVRHQRHR